MVILTKIVNGDENFFHNYGLQNKRSLDMAIKTAKKFIGTDMLLLQMMNAIL